VLLVVFDTSRRLTVFDEDYMETPWAVRTELDALLDVRRPRRTGNEVDYPRQGFRCSGGP
jgi:hypothetical protein